MKRKTQEPRRKSRRPATPAALPSPEARLPLDAEATAYMGKLTAALIALNAAQQDWTYENEELVRQPEVLEDAAWRARAQAAMDAIVAASIELAVKPVPARMAAVGSIMDKVAAHAQAMSSDYAIALATRDRAAVQSLKNHSTRMFSYIKQAQTHIPR